MIFLFHLLELELRVFVNILLAVELKTISPGAKKRLILSNLI